jgi:hypothetical protein
MSVPHSALCGVNFEQRQVRKPSAEEEEEEETKGLHDERKRILLKGKIYLLDCILDTSGIFILSFKKKTYPLIKIIFSFVRLTSLCATFKRKKTVCMIITTKINSITITHR